MAKRFWKRDLVEGLRSFMDSCPAVYSFISKRKTGNITGLKDERTG